jgi:ABC-type transport system involved in cytochrome bd biosynthesis fused ATPase/permease subunit
MGHANFTWSADPSPRFTLRLEQDVVFAPGRTNLIVGPTGCGKTAFLLALLGELHFVPTSSRSWVNLSRAGGVAYAAQESWVLNDTIRNNIVFGSDFDEARYKQGRNITLVYACDDLTNHTKC